MTIYIKGINESNKSISAYSIYDDSGKQVLIRSKRTPFSDKMPSTNAHYCNELLAATSAINNELVPANAHITIRTNDKTIASWLSRPREDGINLPQDDYYRQFWQYLVTKPLPMPTIEYVKKGLSQELDYLRTYAINS